MNAMRWAVGLSVLFFATRVFAQGSLTPPGAPAPTMKTLDQLDASIGSVSNAVGQIKGDPRTPISSVPYTILEPGSYYLTTNLTSTGTGVVIATNNVTLDLMGFTLSGDGGSSDYGVFVNGENNSAAKHVVVRNGAVKKFGEGILAEYSLGGRFEQLSLCDNTYYGILLNGQDGQCDGNKIANCTISGNGNSGVEFDGSSSGQCDGNTIADCTLSGNGNHGVYLNGYSGQCNGNTIADCTIRENSSRGIYLDGSSSGQCNGNTIADCILSGNSSRGINLSGYYGQCDGNTVADCTISENGSYGINLYGYSGQCDGNTIAGCTIRKNSDAGIYLYCADGNRVEGNHVTGQTGVGTIYGIYCGGTAQNLIIRNSCVGQTDNFVFDPNDTYGPEISATGMITNMNPWANFSR